MYFHQKIIRLESFFVRTLPFFEKITEQYTRKSNSGNGLTGKKRKNTKKAYIFIENLVTELPN